MNQDIKKRWVEALRSGLYTQGREALCRIDDNGNRTWCCLGVLTDLARQEGIIFEGDPEPDVESLPYRNPQGFPVSRNYLSRDVVLWSGITGVDSFANPVVQLPNGGTLPLAALNDSGVSFREIANLIEAQL
jgi:hypothetical protein